MTIWFTESFLEKHADTTDSSAADWDDDTDKVNDEDDGGGGSFFNSLLFFTLSKFSKTLKIHTGRIVAGTFNLIALFECPEVYFFDTVHELTALR